MYSVQDVAVGRGGGGRAGQRRGRRCSAGSATQGQDEVENGAALDAIVDRALDVVHLLPAENEPVPQSQGGEEGHGERGERGEEERDKGRGARNVRIEPVEAEAG